MEQSKEIAYKLMHIILRHLPKFSKSTDTILNESNRELRMIIRVKITMDCLNLAVKVIDEVLQLSSTLSI